MLVAVASFRSQVRLVRDPGLAVPLRLELRRDAGGPRGLPKLQSLLEPGAGGREWPPAADGALGNLMESSALEVVFPPVEDLLQGWLVPPGPGPKTSFVAA